MAELKKNVFQVQYFTAALVTFGNIFFVLFANEYIENAGKHMCRRPNGALCSVQVYLRFDPSSRMFLFKNRKYYAVKGKTCRQAKDADGKFCQGKRCQRQPSVNHMCVRKRLIDA